MKLTLQICRNSAFPLLALLVGSAAFAHTLELDVGTGPGGIPHVDSSLDPIEGHTSPLYIQDGAHYAIVSRHSGKCFDVTEWSRTPGEIYQQWDCNYGQPNQTWRVSGSHEGGWALFSDYNGLCVTVAGNSPSSGAAVVQSDQCYGSAIRLRLVPTQNSAFLIVFDNSHKCVDVSGWATWNGAKLIQWDCHGGANQEWYLYPHRS